MSKLTTIHVCEKIMIDCKMQLIILVKEASKTALFIAKIKFYDDFFNIAA
tara:strand:- start:258 stop:407 length:150 start_codon:yes stop_codon:yes gene_type:complete